MTRYTIAVLVRNQFGVLNRVTSMFRRRQFNISALNVSETESQDYSRITVVFDGEDLHKKQLVSQLYKLPDVCSIKEFKHGSSVNCELMLIKLENNPETRADIRAAADAFNAVTVDYSHEAIMFRLVDSSRRIDEFIELVRDYNILEICRTGTISLEKGNQTLRQIINF